MYVQQADLEQQEETAAEKSEDAVDAEPEDCELHTTEKRAGSEKLSRVRQGRFSLMTSRHGSQMPSRVKKGSLSQSQAVESKAGEPPYWTELLHLWHVTASPPEWTDVNAQHLRWKSLMWTLCLEYSHQHGNHWVRVLQTALVLLEL